MRAVRFDRRWLASLGLLASVACAPSSDVGEPVAAGTERPAVVPAATLPNVASMQEIAPYHLQRSSTAALPQRFGLGNEASAAQIAALDIDIMPDGRGLPPGSGTVDEGARLYAANCAVCHGPEGIGGPEGSLVGRVPDDAFDFGDGLRAERTIGSYWPWATTVFDYVRRAMPWDRPGSLSDDEVYALTAWLLYRNEIIAADVVLDAETLPRVVMPSRDRFVADDRLETNAVR